MSPKRRRNHYLLQIERLEDRLAPAVFGFDNRTQLGEDNLINPIASFPAPFGDVFAAYPAIGMLVNDANRNGTPDRHDGGGTLFLIGRNWALTSAHCLYLKDVNGNVVFNPPDSQLLGFFGWDGTTAHSGVAGVKVRYIPPEWKSINGTFKDGKAVVPLAATRYDWALLELDVNIGDRAKVWFDVLGDPAKTLEATFSAGHPSDSGPTNGNGPFIGYRPMVATNGPANRVFDGRIEYLPQDYSTGLGIPPYFGNGNPRYLRRSGESDASYNAREGQRYRTLGLDTFAGQSGSPIWASQPPDLNVPRYSQYQVYGIVSSGDSSGNFANYLGDNAVARLKSFFGIRAVGDINRVADPESDEINRPILTSSDRLFDTANDVAASYRMIGEGRVKFFVERFTLYNRGLATAATTKVSFHLVDASTLAPVDFELATDWDGTWGQVSVPPSGSSRQYQFDLYSVGEVPFGQYRVGWKIEQDGAPGFDSGLFPQTISIRPYGIIEGLPDQVLVRYGRESDPIPFTVRTVSGSVEETLQFAVEYPSFPDGPFGTQAPMILDPAGFRFTGMGTERTLTFRPIWNGDRATGTGSGPTGTTQIYVTDYNLGALNFSITVQVLPNEAPLITAPLGLTMIVGQTKSLDITLDDDRLRGQGITLSAASDNPTLLPASGIILGGMEAHRTVELSPAAGHTGFATVTLTATDADGLSRTQSFNLEVVDNQLPPFSPRITLDKLDVKENLSGLVVGPLAVEDEDPVETLLLSVKDSRFEIVDRILKLKDGISLQLTDGATVTVEITARNSGTTALDLVEPFVLNVLANPRPWRHDTEPSDTNADGSVVPLDVLRIINQLNEPTILGPGGRLPDARAASSALPFYDVNGDGFCTTNDVLRVINFLNRQQGEGEANGPFVTFIGSLVSEMSQVLDRPAALATRPSMSEPGSLQPVTSDSRKIAMVARTESWQPPRRAEKTLDLESEVDAILDEIAGDVTQSRRHALA